MTGTPHIVSVAIILTLSTPALADDFGTRPTQAALERTHHTVRHDPAYAALVFPRTGPYRYTGPDTSPSP